ncbi:MAG TPA: PHP domain-containing protein [Dehalococcoidia bacterium]|nr:PHP domain-containing protein [Dehalococcoidia bacterium]HAI09831.1 PHP domain-containing protein [Dehalococcoidia bacterium]|tara:strand:- start:723 stop:1574 length:852 start_codon:yes stop_codon:yes gene_type:complete
MSALVDLHLHTTASDGRLSPTELIHLLASQGLKQVAISDHDTTEGLAEAFAAAEEFPDMRIIPAIELSTDIPGDEVHMLGYFLRHEDEELQKILREFRMGRLERGRMMVEKLATLGINIEWERVQEIAGEGSVGRPHIALAMVEKGYCKEPKDAFPEYLGRNGSAYVERSKMTPPEAVDMLIRFGAVPVLAHPAYLNDMETTIAELAEAGIVGLEVHYAQFSPETVQQLAGLADRYGLIPCGGSDYHGLGNEGEPLPGTLGPPPETVGLLEEAASKIAAAAGR